MGNESLEDLGGSSRTRAEVLVDRSHCLFAEIDASDVPTPRRRDFIELSVKRFAPFDDPEVDVAWFGSHAAVWYWPRSRMPTIDHIRPAGIQWLAEARRLDRVREDGLYLFELPTGWMARCWQSGRLIAERWWREKPDFAAWSTFARGVGQPAPNEVPAQTLMDGPGSPFGDSMRISAFDFATGIGPRKAALWSGAISAVAGAFFLSAWLSAALSASSWRDRVEEASRQAEDVLDARNQIESSRERIEALLSLRPPSSPSRILKALSETLNARSWRMQSFSIIDRDRIEAIGSLEDGDAAQLVAALEGVPEFRDAVIENLPNSQDQLLIRIRLRERTPAVSAGAGEDEQ